MASTRRSNATRAGSKPTAAKRGVPKPTCACTPTWASSRGHIKGGYADGCAFELEAPQAVAVEPGHDAWVAGREPAVLIQFDCEDDTARRFGLPEEHTHG